MGRAPCILVLLLIFSAFKCSSAKNDYADRDENPENGEFFEGDMVLTNTQKMQLNSRRFKVFEKFLWTDEVDDGISFAFDDDVSNDTRDAIYEGLEHWENKTCLQFVEVESGASVSHLRFFVGTGCWSFVGKRQNNYANKISIGSGCATLGTVSHEVGHALGMFHEQSRSDRDDNVEIIYDNIESGSEKNFLLKSTDNYDVPYDFYSMMHYGRAEFSSDGKPTLRSKIILPEKDVQMGQRGKGFSYYDALIVNRAYGCTDRWLSDCDLTTSPCVHGYVGADCNCICRPGTSGTFCDVDEKSYDVAVVELDESLSARNITEPQQITSLNFPGSVSGTRQDTLITAPVCQNVVLTFTEFLMRDNCVKEYLEIRSNLSQVLGDTYCGTDIGANATFRSVGRQMMLYEKYKSRKRGWAADVTFENDDECTTTATSIGDCNVTQTGEKEFLFTSPAFPSVIRELFSCSLELSSNVPSTYLVKIDYFKGLRSIFQYNESSPYVGQFGNYYSLNTVTLGLSTSSISYSSPFNRERMTFSMLITVQHNDDNRIVNLESGETFTIDLSEYEGNTFLEYWFLAPEGYQLQISFEVFNIGESTEESCEGSDYVRVDVSGDPTYGDSVFGCQEGNVLSQLLSSSNSMNVFVNGRQGGGSLKAVVYVVSVA